jgi:predicted component of type VI protein secretion system
MVFVGVITADADQILATQLGEDTRPKCRLMLQRPAPVTLTAQNMIRDEAGNRFRVVQRMDNPDQTAIEYELIQISEGKDT